MNKNKSTLGGARVGAGRRCKWRRRPTKVIRVPIEFAEKIIELIDYMDANRGELPENSPTTYTPDFDEWPYPSRFKPRAFIYSDEVDDEDEGLDIPFPFL